MLSNRIWFLAPKSYGCKCPDGKTERECNGKTLNYNNSKQLIPDNMREWIKGDVPEIAKKRLGSDKNQKQGTITIKRVDDLIPFSEETFKRKIKEDYKTNAFE